MTKFLFALFLFATPAFAGFFSDEVVIQKDLETCEKSMERFSVVLEAALRVPITQLTTRPTYDACTVSFTYFAKEKIQIDQGGWPSGIMGGLCEVYRKMADRRFLDVTTIPLLAGACSGSIFKYSYVNHAHYVPSQREEVFLVNVSNRPMAHTKVAKLLADAGGEKLEYFSAGEDYGYAYRLDNNLKRVTVTWDSGVMPFTDNGYVYSEDKSKGEEACDIESRIASSLSTEMTEIGTHYECFVGKEPSMTIGMSPWQLKGGKLPKENKAHPGWWQDWVPLAGYERELLKCQAQRELAMVNYERFTGKKPLYALCMERDGYLAYWMLGK